LKIKRCFEKIENELSIVSSVKLFFVILKIKVDSSTEQRILIWHDKKDTMNCAMTGRAFPDSRLRACLGYPAGKQKCARGQCRVWAGLNCSKPSGKFEGRMDANRCKGKEAQRSREGNSVPVANSVKLFCDELEKGIRELYRVLKEDSHCAFLIGDTRRGRHYIPLAYYVMERFLKNGFALKEDVIKGQYNCNSTPYWQNQQRDFLLIMHEHLFIFRKPGQNEDLSRIRYSMIR